MLNQAESWKTEHAIRLFFLSLLKTEHAIPVIQCTTIKDLLDYIWLRLELH